MSTVAKAIRAQQGDAIDLIVWREYGNLSGALQAVMDANPHLRNSPPVLSGGELITLPEVTPVPVVQSVPLWS